MLAALIKLGENMGTHPHPTTIVHAKTLLGLEGQIDLVRTLRAEIANRSAMDHWRKMLHSARLHGEVEPAPPRLFQPSDFPILWQGDPEDQALDAAFRERLARDIQRDAWRNRSFMELVR